MCFIFTLDLFNFLIKTEIVTINENNMQDLLYEYVTNCILVLRNDFYIKEKYRKATCSALESVIPCGRCIVNKIL